MDNTKREPLYQVWALDTKTGELVAVPMFPRARKESAEEWAGVMHEQIRFGREKRYKDPIVSLHLRTV